MGWKANERKMYECIIEKTKQKDLKMSKDKYSRVDCYNDQCIVELKYRTDDYGPSNYDTTIIEKEKYENLKTYCHGRTAIYAVQAEKKIYLFDLNKLHKEHHEYRWENRGGFNTTTHFSNRAKKSKYVGYIPWEKAVKVIEVD